jgi:magnesium chelatase subunit I
MGTLASTLGELKASGWQSVPVKEEIRRNAVARIQAGQPLFEGVMGYEHTVMPQLENAVLAGHDIIFLGERGQAKTRMIRSLTGLLDEWMPVVAGSEIHDDPFHPVSRHARDLIAEQGDATPIAWVHRDDRFGEKLATPDTSIADLIGEVDPIKVAEGRYLSDELTLHRAPTAASSRSTRSPTSPSASRSVCSTCSKNATCRSVATRSACRSISCWWPVPTPRTTPIVAGSSPR